MEKMIIFTGTLSHGGSERVISLLSKSFTDKYGEVEILLYHKKDIWYSIDNRVKIVTVDAKYNNIFSKMYWIRRYIKQSNPNIVLSFLSPFNVFLIITLLGIKIPLIVAERNDPRHIPHSKIGRSLRNILYNFASKVVVQTPNNKNYFSKRIQEKCHVIYNPVAINVNINNRVNISDTLNIVTVGRLIEQKNQKMIIDAFKRVQDLYPQSNLIIYGEGNLRGYLTNLIEEYNLQDKVFLAGVHQNVIEQIQDASLFVLSSNFEGMPNALIEAMCLGIPCISTKVSGAIDLIENGKNGLLVEVGNVDELTEKIIAVLSSKNLADNLGKESMKIAQKLSVDTIANEWIKVLTE